MVLPESVRIYEVGPRDGLQNESQVLPLKVKIEFINLLSAAGLSAIEVASCVPPEKIPQMAGGREVLAGISKISGNRYPLLVPNMHGLERAISAGAGEVSVIASASEAFSLKNSNCSIDAGLQRCAEIINAAQKHGIAVRGYVSCTLGCPYEGRVAIEKVVNVVTRLSELGCPEIALSDTIGVGTPLQVTEMIEKVAQNVPMAALAVHFHDTYGQALANIMAAMEVGITTIDSSVAGLGGCPYASGASGNVASEDLLYMLDGLGIRTGVDLKSLVAAGNYICKVLARPSGSKVARAMTLSQGNPK